MLLPRIKKQDFVMGRRMLDKNLAKFPDVWVGAIQNPLDRQFKTQPGSPCRLYCRSHRENEVHFFPREDFPAETGRPGVGIDGRSDIDRATVPTNLGNKVIGWTNQGISPPLFRTQSAFWFPPSHPKPDHAVGENQDISQRLGKI